MKAPIEINDGNTLVYSKNVFTREEVLNEKKNMGHPEAWNLGEDRYNFYLEFSELSYNILLKQEKRKKILSTVFTGKF